MTWLTVTEYLCHKDHIYDPLLVNNNQSLFHSSLITGFISRVTRRVPLAENELPTLPEHLGLLQALIGVRGARSIVICVLFCRSFFVLLPVFFWPLCCLSFFDLRILITPLLSSTSSFLLGTFSKIRKSFTSHPSPELCIRFLLYYQALHLCEGSMSLSEETDTHFYTTCFSRDGIKH